MVDRDLVRLFRLHYFRGTRPVSPRAFQRAFYVSASVGLGACLLAGSAVAQYPGQIEKKSTKDSPTLRAIGVLEWTGAEGKPGKSRLVPITVYDGETLHDGNVYLARPYPMALGYEVEYVLERNGKAIGLYDIQKAGQEDGMWVGFGSWKPMPHAKQTPSRPVAGDGGFGADDDKPVLHRRQSAGSGDTASSEATSAPADPDRPTLHKKTDSSDSGGSAPAPVADPDRPTLHGSADGSSSKPDSGPNTQSREPGLDTDPSRPHLTRGKPADSGPEVLPSLVGMPTEMEQAVAVSDAKTRPARSWDYSWANPADEDKMKADMEEIARQALAPKAPAAKSPAPNRASAKHRASSEPPTEPLKLVDETFRVFELSYGGGATLVLTARTDGPPQEQKFVTLIAQPDLYGNVLVLLKSVTSAAHLDDTPRMRLVDAVDALADNRGELLFELRGATQRQFALYRVLRGSAERIFVTGGGEFGISPGE
jgi:hypothetical protein